MDTLKVRPDWDDNTRTAKVPFYALRRPHWVQPPGSTQFFIYAYIRCDQILEGDLAHTCSGTELHVLRVCVLKDGNWKTFYKLLARVGRKPLAKKAQRSTAG
jgi:hypothetical protein